ncbi:MAG: winged helix-turn-helix domain-containing protein [Woeseiaceae bacterium]|nr:winged helix-turn-helix domain-containing protein [Woeseiaceae bacterium]
MSQESVYRFDDFLVDPETWKLTRAGDEVHLEPVVLKLLIYLISHRDRLVTRQELMDTVWGDTVISESALSQAVARVRRALGDDPASPRYLETVHSQGFRFIAEVVESQREERPDAGPGPATKRRGLYAGVAAIVALLLLVVWTGTLRDEGSAPDEVQSLAVLPLDNLTGDPAQDYYVEGLQELLIVELSHIPELRVTSRQSTRRYRDSTLPTADIAGELGVDALVEGSLLREGNRIEVTIQLIDGQSDEHLWAQRYARETPYVFEVITDVSGSIAGVLGRAPMQPDSGGSADQWGVSVDPRAVDAYSLGLTYLDRNSADDIRLSIEHFEEAVTIEPEFALGWGHLGGAYAMQGLYGHAPPHESIEKAHAAALRAIEADDEHYIGFSALGWISWWTGDFDGACELFREALSRNPSDPYALHGDADCLMFAGRVDENIARTRELLLVGPYSAMHNRPLAYHLFLARRYDEAIAATQAMQARVSHFSVHWLLAQIYWVQGDFDRALDEERLEFEWRNDVVLLAALEDGLDAGGPMGAMGGIAEALVARAEESYVDPFLIGETYARAGMVDEALYWMNTAIDYGSYEMAYIAFRPDFDVLRDDPRYEQLAQRVYGEKAQEIGQVSDPDSK